MLDTLVCMMDLMIDGAGEESSARTRMGGVFFWSTRSFRTRQVLRWLGLGIFWHVLSYLMAC